MAGPRSRLERRVAVKVLPEEFAQNAQLRMRLEREAKSISQLNHPNNCTLYDVGHHDGVDYREALALNGSHALASNAAGANQ